MAFALVGVVVAVVLFLVLRPEDESREALDAGRPLPAALQRVLLSTALRVLLAARLGLQPRRPARWLEGGEAFNVHFGLLARIAPFAVREADGKREV